MVFDCDAEEYILWEDGQCSEDMIQIDTGGTCSGYEEKE